MYTKVANFILSDKHNRLYSGEKHGIIYLPDGTYNPAEFMGAGTKLGERVSLGQKGLSEVDVISRAHDERYVLQANNEADVQRADQKMIDSIANAREKKLDYPFNLNQAELIRLKQLANRAGFGTKEWFTSYGRDSVDQKYIPMLEADLASLQQRGYGAKARPRRLYKDDKGYYYKSNNQDESYKSYIKTGSNSSGRDLYIINLQNQKPVPRKAPAKKDSTSKDSEDKPTKMIPKIGAGGGGSGNVGVPSTKQEVVNAYAEGVNASSPKIQEYKTLLDKSKQIELDLKNTIDEQDKQKLEAEKKILDEAIGNYDLSDDDKEQARLENLSTYTPSEYSVRTPRRLLPFVGDTPSEYDNEYQYGVESQYGNDSVSTSSSQADGFQPPPPSPSSSISSSDTIPQPVIEPVVETESLQPLDNTPTEDTVSALEAKLGRQIKDEGNVLEDTKLTNEEKKSIQSVGPSYDELQSTGTTEDKPTNIRPVVQFKAETKDNEKTPKKFTHFSQIVPPTRRIKILLGEADLTPQNRTFLTTILEKIPLGGRVTSKILNKTDKETIDMLWRDYTLSIRLQDQKDIIDRYLLQTGFGINMSLKEANDKGLKTSDIEELMEKYNHINLPVIPSDYILSLKKNITKNTKLFPFIMNLDPSDKSGSHWVAVILDNRDKYVGYYDSLCLHPSKQILKDLKELVKTMDPIHMFKFKFNTVQDQGRDSGKCGMYAMGFLHKILNGMDFKRASGYFNKDWKHGESKIDRLMAGFGFL